MQRVIFRGFLVWMALAPYGASAQEVPPAATGTSTPTTVPTDVVKSGSTDVFDLRGYLRFTVGGRAFICREEDRLWVEAAVGGIDRDLGGTTQPSDLFARLDERRDAVLALMLNDLPTLRPSQVDALFDQELLPLFRRLSGFKYRPVFLVATTDALKEQIRAGWSHPKVRLNSVSDRIEIDRGVNLSPDASADDASVDPKIDAGAAGESLVVALFDPGQPEEGRRRSLAQFVVGSDRQVGRALSTRATSAAVVKVADFIAREALSALPRGEDQVWLSVGLSNVLAAKYVSTFHGSPYREFVEALVVGTAGQSINALQVDLLAPLPTSSLKPEAVAAYLDARRRKAIAVTYLLVRDAGEKSVMPLVTAVERLRPADGVTLAETVKSVSGIDLSNQLRAR
ncbi:MAG TPA: hypothetical protein VF624_05370 [Tepidisphaeraceae bacterium]